MIRRTSLCSTLVALLLVVHIATFADDAKPEKKEAARVVCASPLAVAPGTTTTIVLRGFKLDTATEAAVADKPENDGMKVAIRKKGKAEGAKDDKAKLSGDTQAEIEVTLPGAMSEQVAEIVLKLSTPTGPVTSKPIRVIPAAKLVDEKEPNGGFRTAQVLPPGACTVRGAIGEEKDVDVFRFSAAAGQTVTAAVVADDAGSALDGILTLYDAAGHVVAVCDDIAGHKDPSISRPLPQAGEYYLVVTDANDRGGPTSPYLLNVDVK